MTKCLYCTEYVHEDAIACSRCGRPLPTGYALLNPTTKGRFVVGLSAQEGKLGVWDLAQGGPPIQVFEESDEGWQYARWLAESLEPKPLVGVWIIALVCVLLATVGAWVTWGPVVGMIVFASAAVFTLLVRLLARG